MVLLLLAPLVASGADVVVGTEAGPVQGASDGGVVVFRGISYAVPPVGALRWRSPAPVASWTSPRDATSFGARCPQPGRANQRTNLPTSEDCLTLNVWTPSIAGEAPVMVWIHGGAFRVGSSSQPLYDGTAFARDGIVLVSLNYRLGRLGFFAHPALDDKTANYGLADQIAALEWVQRNIRAFGGDPARVTVFGESAGGASVLHLLASPPARGLFRGAIIQSGGGHQLDRYTDRARGARPSLAAEGEAWAKRVGADSAEALRALPLTTIVGDRIEGGIGAVGPVIDGRIVTDDPGVLLAKGALNHVPVLVGANSFEASVLAAFGTDASTLVANVPLDAAAVASAYGSLGGTALDNALFGDAAFVAPSRHVARSVARAGEPAYLYYFDYVLERRRDKVPGAGHGSEIPFVFETLAQLPMVNALLTSRDRAMAQTLHRYWVNFAMSGDPNGKGLPRWPRLTPDDEQTLVISRTIEAVKDFRAATLDLHQRRWEMAERGRL
jgi:para-nitrobenzyl esterase